jgi:hypothetical protein
MLESASRVVIRNPDLLFRLTGFLKLLTLIAIFPLVNDVYIIVNVPVLKEQLEITMLPEVAVQSVVGLDIVII